MSSFNWLKISSTAIRSFHELLLYHFHICLTGCKLWGPDTARFHLCCKCNSEAFKICHACFWWNCNELFFKLIKEVYSSPMYLCKRKRSCTILTKYSKIIFWLKRKLHGLLHFYSRCLLYPSVKTSGLFWWFAYLWVYFSKCCK